LLRIKEAQHPFKTVGLQKMNKTVTAFAALALAGLAGPGWAADLGARPITKAPIAAPIPVYNWSGCYIGANAGGKWGKFNRDVTAGTFPAVTVFGFDGVNDDFDSSFMGGGQIGCQWQSGAWVWGIEGDFDGTDLRRSFIAPVTVLAPFLPGDTVDFKNRWQASIRGRLGYAWDRFMIYATGGVAFADVKTTIGLVPVAGAFPTLFFEDSQTLTGGTVGAGLEYGITDNLSLGVEYRYSKFSHETFVFPTAFAVPLTADTDLTTHEVTARLNWRFNWFGGGPVAARY